ncbi:NAD(P)/FAD-dependent oxidoreductase [Solirhodobacter olei]|uniref:NAD(P)/FAD-dependent oxidoreductase n=1 Tax=Solirhodobacter olei TaxID=2493082 RepID=UPI000FD89740|nr:FAD-binding oxidoreductase [Solirhodobacter olei]
MATADVTVMGGGIFGLSVAYACLRKGATVRLIEARAIGAGSSGGLVGALAPHVPDQWNEKKAFQLESLLMAEGYWREIERLSGLSAGYARTGRLQPLADAKAVALAEARAESAREIWGDRAVWRVAEAAAFPGWAPEGGTGLVVHDTLSARMHPQRAAAALAAAIEALGGEIVLGPGRAEGAVVWATGHEGLAELSRALGREVGNGVKGQSLSLRYEAGALPQLFAGGLHVVPHADGTVAIGSTSERVFTAADTVDGQLDDLHARAVAAVPALAGAEVVARWAGVRPRAASRAPMLGPWPGRAGHYVANGGFKIGFGVAPMVGEVMAALVLAGQDRIPEGFRVEASLER